MGRALQRFFTLLACCLLGGCGSILEFPPFVPDPQNNGGRTHAITVSPTNRSDIVIATDFGGLWRTRDGARTWAHVRSLVTVFAVDVQFGSDGRTLVATIAGDGRRENRGGIWVSRDAGESWIRPIGGSVPGARILPAGPGAWGISAAPDEPRRWYVGTDVGVALSEDNGDTWEHVNVDASLTDPGDDEGRHGAARSVLALAGGRALAMLDTGIYRTDDHGRHWRKVIDGDFTFNLPFGSFNKMDRSPNGPLAFILKDYETLLVYDLNTETVTPLTLPAPESAVARGPYVRVAKPRAGPDGQQGEAITIWIGQGVYSLYATVSNPAAIPTLLPSDWSRIGTEHGVHEDTGDLGLDGVFRPVLLGTDGGVFKPSDESLLLWESAAKRGSQMNSFQITDLAGANVESEAKQTFLYFGTQDNDIWASPDGGVTWPKSDCPEGYALETRPRASTPAQVAVAYFKYGCSPPFMLASADFTTVRAVPDLGLDGTSISNMGLSYFLTATPPGGNDAWLRMRFPPDTPNEVYISLDNAATWRRRFVLAYPVAGHIARTAIDRPVDQAQAWIPVDTGEINLGGRSRRIGLLRMRDMTRDTVDTLDDAALITLSDGGSLGSRATMFDWHAVFGVHPTDADFVIAPDIVATVMRVTRDGGRTWPIDENLTRLVLLGGELPMYSNDVYYMQVTVISFDPYRPDRILVGTRDAGIICSADRGLTWQRIPGSRDITYVTGFHFLPEGGVHASSYGRGLWTLYGDGACANAPANLSLLTSVAATGEQQRNVPEHVQRAPRVQDTPLLWVSSSLPPTGAPVVGRDSLIILRGQGFTAHAGKRLPIMLDARRRVGEAIPDAKGNFLVRITLPHIRKGMHRMRILSSDQAGQPLTMVEFMKANLDDHLGKPAPRIEERVPQRPPDQILR